MTRAQSEAQIRRRLREREEIERGFSHYVQSRYTLTFDLIRYDYPSLTWQEFQHLWQNAVLPYI